MNLSVCASFEVVPPSWLLLLLLALRGGGDGAVHRMRRWKGRETAHGSHSAISADALRGAAALYTACTVRDARIHPRHVLEGC